jgi:oligopeptide transport system substrate-binding protein
LALGAAALAWAVSFGTLPRADFSFDNGNEVQTIDPAKATGQPENRVINALFEGLLRTLPPAEWQQEYGPDDNVPLKPQPAMADMPEVSDDGRVYTFHIRKGREWSDGTPVTSHDFAWSWMRALHPETASQYAYQLYYIQGAEAYNTATINPGDAVEVELANRPNPLQLFPRGAIRRGILREIRKPPAPQTPPDASETAKSRADAAWRKAWVYLVDIEEEGHTAQFAFATGPEAAEKAGLYSGKIEACMHVLPDFEKTVGVETPDDHTLVVTLNRSTPYFTELVAFYTYYPVNRRCIETHGVPDWSKPGNIVTNGPFLMEFRRIRDRIRLRKNPRYWAADSVKLNTVDVMAVKSETTSFNMYMNGQIDWATTMPISIMNDIEAEMPQQFRSAPMLTVYFYRVNVTRPGLNDKRVRRALNLAIDKQNICQVVTKAGEVPATTYVPPGLADYHSPKGMEYNIEEARRLLAEAGYPNGRGLPTVEILYNDLDAHRTIAERIQQLWRENLGIDAQLRGLEWGVYLDSQQKLDYDVCRAAWIADYPDPNTFLDMFTSENQQNQTGWKNARYDELINRAAAEPDVAARMKLLQEAETILLDELPILPIYFYVSKNLVKPNVRGFFNNVQDTHWLSLIEVIREDSSTKSPQGGR